MYVYLLYCCCTIDLQRRTYRMSPIRREIRAEDTVGDDSTAHNWHQRPPYETTEISVGVYDHMRLYNNICMRLTRNV